MTVSIKQHFKFAPLQEGIELKRVMSAVLADMGAMRTAITGITAQLDTDIAAGGASDTDYAANNDPAALTLIA
jgi:hypothetical protein